MIVLKKIFSPSGLFDEIQFKSGLNIIRGVYETEKKEKGELNGIGKSSLVRLIDFALISDTTKAKYKYFDVKKHDFFKGHSVVLELEADDITLYLKREFERPNLPSFGDDLSSLQEYDERHLRKILGQQFFAQSKYNGYFESKWFRRLIRFFIKDDIENYLRRDLLFFYSGYATKFEALCLNLFLLDLPNKSAYEYKELKSDQKSLKDQRKDLVERLEEETGKKLEKINSEIQLLDERIKIHEKALSEYKLLETYGEIENTLLLVTKDISEKLRRLTLFNRRLEEFKRSHEIEVEVDTDRIERMYSEVDGIFGEIVKRELNEVMEFRKQLAKNRETFLHSRETELKEEIEEIKKAISLLEEKRSNNLRLLDEKKALDGIKNAMTILVEKKAEKEKLVTSISNIERIDEKINTKNIEIPKTVSNLAQDINSAKVKVNEITSLFLEIISKTTSISDTKDVFFNIRTSPSIRSPLEISVGIPKTEALGMRRFEILSYDLTVFLFNIQKKRKFPAFLIHDGIFHAIDKRITINVQNYIYSQYLRYPRFQYIFTANEDELLIPEEKRDIYGKYDFDLEDCVIATYKDTPESMIFKREYS